MSECNECNRLKDIIRRMVGLMDSLTPPELTVSVWSKKSNYSRRESTAPADDTTRDNTVVDRGVSYGIAKASKNLLESAEIKAILSEKRDSRS